MMRMRSPYICTYILFFLCLRKKTKIWRSQRKEREKIFYKWFVDRYQLLDSWDDVVQQIFNTIRPLLFFREYPFAEEFRRCLVGKIPRSSTTNRIWQRSSNLIADLVSSSALLRFDDQDLDVRWKFSFSARGEERKERQTNLSTAILSHYICDFCRSEVEEHGHIHTCQCR